MPIGLPAMLVRCPKCRWSSLLGPMSDAIPLPLPPGTRPSVCPKCGNTKLDYSPAGPLTLIFARIKKYIDIRVGNGR